MKLTLVKRVLAFSLLFIPLSQLPVRAQTLQDPVQPVNIILDSDMAQNADDVGDHAMLWALAARGEANVLALILSSTNDYSAACAQAVATFYGHPSVLIGANKTNIPGVYQAGFSYYTQQVAQRFGLGSKTRALFPDAVAVYRQALAAAPDHSVYIVSGGYYRPLRDLLTSGPDAISPLTGIQLVSQKVRRLIPVAGRFPDSFTGSGNLGVDPDSASYLVANWPTEIVWVPDDQLWNVMTGPAPGADPNTNPVKYAYDLYCAPNHCAAQTPAWAQGGLLNAIRGGVGVDFRVGGQNGSTVVWGSSTSAPGRSIWSQTPDRQHAYILTAISSVQMAAILNPLVQWIPPQGGITQPPVAASQSVTTPGVAVPIVLSATDPQGATLTYIIATQPTHGSLSGSAPNLTYTPTPGYVGADSFTFRASNGLYESNTAVVSISVTPAGGNRAPVANPQSVTTFGDPVSITLTATDPDGDPLTYAVVTQPAHGTLSGSAPNLTYTPQTGYAGSDSFQFTANDGRLSSAAATVTITVSSAYRMRVNAGSASAFTDGWTNVWQADTGYNGGTSYSTTAAITATAGDPVLYQTLRYADTNLQYNFSNLPNGTYSVNLYFAEIASSCFRTGCRVFDVVVQNALVLDDFDVYAAAGGGNIGIARSATAVVSDGNLNLTFRAALTQYPIVNAIELVLLPPNSADYGSISGTVTQAGSGSAIPGAAVAFNGEPAITDNNGGYTLAHLLPGAYAVTVTARNYHSSTQTVMVTAGATTTVDFALSAPQPPVAVSQSVTTVAGVAVPIVLSATDPQGAALTYIVVTQPAHGALSGTAPNLTYTPAAGYVGADSFTFRASNGSVDSNTAVVSITVTAGNRAPVATSQSASSFGDPIPITLSGVDPDGDPLTYAVVTQPAYGTLSGSVPNLTYTPQSGYTGSDSFQFRVNDGRLDSAPATVSITVSATPYRMRVNAGGAAITDASGNLWQGDTGYIGGLTYSTTEAISTSAGDPVLYQTLRYTDTALPYSFSNLPNGTYAVNLYFAEIASNCFRAGCRVFDVLVQNALVLDDFDVYAAAGGANIGIARSATAVVADGNLNLTFRAALTAYPIINAIELVLLPPNSPNHGSISGAVTQAGAGTPIPGATVAFNGDPAITGNNGGYTLAHLLPGAYTLTVTARNYQTLTQTVTVSAGATTTANFALSAPQAPVAASQSVTTAGIAIPIVLSATDPQGVALTYTVVTQPAHGSLSGSAPNLTYTPAAGYVGADSFTFRASNGTLESNTAVVSITVTAANQPPVATSQSVSSAGDPISITLTATDPDGDPLAYTVLTQPAHGALSGSAPNLTYTPHSGYIGSDSFQFRVSDGRLDSAAATVSITVTAPPQPPVGASQSVTTAGVAIPIVLSATDPQGVALTYTVVTQPAHGSLSGTAPNLTYTPAAGYVGADSFTFRASNGTLESNTAVVSITVTAANRPPVANPQSVSSTGVPISITLSGTDPDGDPLTYTVLTQPAHGTLSGSAPNLTYTPQSGYIGSDSFQFRVNDGRLDSAAATVSITVTAPLQPPVAASQSVTTPAGVPVLTVLTATDPQGAALTYIVATQPTHGSLSGTAPNLTYAPAAGYVGADSFTFRASNGTLESNTALVSITITAINHPPVANPQSVSTFGDPTSISLSGADPDGDPLTYAVLTQPAHGTLSGSAPNLTYTPQSGYTGSDSFQFRASDGRLDSAAATVSITASAASYRMRVNAGGPSITDARGNPWQADTGYDGGSTYSTTASIATTAGDSVLYQTQRSASDALQYSFSNLPNGTYAVNLYFAEISSNCFRAGCRVFDVLVQNALFLDDFDVYASAGGGNIGIARSTTATVADGNLTLTFQAALTQYPIINAIEFVLLPPNSASHGSISGRVTDAGAGTPIPGATVGFNGEPAITDNNGAYTLAHLAPGSYTLTASARGYQGLTQTVAVTAGATATANFAVSATQPPVAVSQSVATLVGVAVPIVLSATDPQGAALTYIVATQPAHGSLSGTAPNLTYTPLAGYAGSDSFTFRASNGILESNTAAVSITVTAPNRPPVATPQSVSSSGGPISITLSGVDPDGDPLTYAVVTQPAHGTLSGTAPNLTYTPQSGYSGSDSFQFRVSDGRLDSATATVSITVSAASYRMRVNAGGPSVTDARGNVWQADTGYNGGTVYSTTAAITAAAGDPILYRTQRYRDSNLQYRFSNLPNGAYAVNLYFAEIASSCFRAGCRVFDVLVQNSVFLRDFDVYATAGGGNIGIARSTTAVVSNGNLTLNFRKGRTPYAIINAIELVLLPPNSASVGSISGTVTRAGAATAIPGATVALNGDAAITGNNGGYTLAHLAPGVYTVTVSARGYQTSTQTVTVTTGATATANFALSAAQ